jgi:hypothetical protein
MKIPSSSIKLNGRLKTAPASAHCHRTIERPVLSLLMVKLCAIAAVIVLGTLPISIAVIQAGVDGVL